ncbi:uncharacterized protein [Procambarus clarkii]|uniref:uncharacterized protein isoform X3 n=1 Tax=Procambarus clarkii TaxID=6728 RepID=UPI003743426A
MCFLCWWARLRVLGWCCVPVMMPWVILLVLEMVAGLQLSLTEVGEDMVVYDYAANKPLCYPSPQEQEPVHLPASHHSWGGTSHFDKNIGRVICRGMGFTHLDRIYKVKKEEGVESSRWMVECLGYEALITHCLPLQAKKAKCEFLMGLVCDTCSRKLDLTEGVTKVITSPEYPSYSDDVLCVWRLQAPTLATITINFTNFRLPNLDSEGQCTRGMLEVAKVVEEEDGPVTMTVVSMCGGALPSPLNVHAHAVILKYTSGVFYPRPFGRLSGFRVLVTANEFDWSPSRLKTVEVVAVVLAVVLVLLAIFLICYICRRSRLGRQRSNQRKEMQKRLAHQQPASHEVALTTMMTSISTSQRTESQFRQQPVGMGRGLGAGTRWPRGDNVTHTTSVPMRQSQYPIPIPPPLPTSAPPPCTRHKDLPVISRYHVQESGEMYEQPVYMEVGQYGRSPMVSYIQLEDIKGKEAVEEKAPPCDPLATGVLKPPTPSTPYTNDLNLFSTQSPFSVSKMSSNKLNVWPSSTSLSPSTRACPSNNNTPSNSNNIHSNSNSPSRVSSNFIGLVNHRSMSSRGSSISSNTGSISPFPGHTPISPCDRSCSDIHWRSSGTTRPASCTLSPKRQNNQREQETPTFLTTPTLERLARDSSYSSCESVFTQGETNYCKAIRCACGSIHSPHTRLGLSFTTSPQGQLSKSCGDVSPTMSVPQTPMLDELVRSEPTLPREQQPAVFVGPILRRVSEMFLDSSPFLWPTPDTKNPVLKKTGCGKLCEGKGVVVQRSVSKSVTDAATPENKIATSDGCLPNRTASTSSFHPFKYNRLENDNTTNWNLSKT